MTFYSHYLISHLTFSAREESFGMYWQQRVAHDVDMQWIDLPYLLNTSLPCVRTCIPVYCWLLGVYTCVCDDLLSRCCIQSPQVVTAGHVRRCCRLPSPTCSPLSASLSFCLLTEGISCEQMLAGSLMHNDCSDVFVWVVRPRSVHCSRCEIIGRGFPRTSHK